MDDLLPVLVGVVVEVRCRANTLAGVAKFIRAHAIGGIGQDDVELLVGLAHCPKLGVAVQ